MAKAFNLSLALDRAFKYEHRVINVTVHWGGFRFREASFAGRFKKGSAYVNCSQMLTVHRFDRHCLSFIYYSENLNLWKSNDLMT